MAKKNAAQQYGPWLLLIGGLAHLIPALNGWLTKLGGGWIQIIVGALSVIAALMLLKK
jgi:hypothetical protein